MKKISPFFCALGLLAMAPPAWAQDYQITVPQVVLRNVPFSVSVERTDDEIDTAAAMALAMRFGTEEIPLRLQEDGTLTVELVATNTGAVGFALVGDVGVIAEASSRAIPGWVSILPPVLAIVIALIFKNVIPALFMGIWVGSWVAISFGPIGLFRGLLDSFNVHVAGALANPGQAKVVLFSFMIGGMVGIISRNGGMQGVVNRIIPWASSASRGQIATGVLGLVIFFDDYANVLVVGNTMRKVTDKLKISREKLAYIVDSTAAPVSCVALVTTWIGYEVGLISAAVAQIDGYSEAAYSVFLQSIPYSFYPLLAMFFVFAVAISGRDFGAMYHAERRARTTGQVFAPGASVDEAATSSDEMKPKEDKAHRAYNAGIPVLVLVSSVLIGLYVTGSGDTLREIIGDADSSTALMWASILGAMTAGLLSVGQRILTLAETVDAWYAGLRSMMFAMIILVLAWSLSSVTGVLNTAGFLVTILGDWLTPGLVPALVFVLSAATAFATGSSWGTMGILMPLVLPLTWAVLAANNVADPSHYHIIYSTVASILAGAVWGDHCSPISDTTILSSMASGCDHIDHVRTQLPYALIVGGVGLVVGTIPTGFGFPWWLSLVVGAVILYAAHRYLAKPVDDLEPLAVETGVGEAV